MVWLLLLVTFFSFLQASFLSVNIVLLLIIGTSLNKPQGGEIWIFISGLIFDLINNLPLGLSSLIFIILTLIINLCQEAWYLWLVVIALILGASSLLFYFQTQTWQLQPALLTMTTGLGIWLLLKWSGIGFTSEKRKLKV